MKKVMVLFLAAICVFSLVGCSSGSSSNSSQASPDKETDKSAGEESTKKDTDKELDEAVDTLLDFIKDSVNNETGNTAAEPVDPKTVDYSKVDITIEFTDADKIEQFMSDYQAGNNDNKVVKFTGIMSKGMMDKTTNSILIKKEGGTKFGPQWRIVDADENTEYPGDDHKIEITGVVISEFNEAWGMYGHYIYVLPENVKDLGYAE